MKNGSKQPKGRQSDTEEGPQEPRRGIFAPLTGGLRI